jgi:fumarate reductase flavoprotein subunit
MMGGVDTDLLGATPLPGLYAAGEVACVSINGANRLGSNSLPELLVFGARAGRAAARFAREQPPPGQAVRTLAYDEQARLDQWVNQANGRERVADLRAAMQQTMERSAGIYRSGASLAEAADVLRRLQERYQDLGLDDHSRTFNTELVVALELGFMLDVAEAVVQAALRREESRGAHQRTDFPARDDAKFLAHSVVARAADGPPRVSYTPVTITRWPPGERVYGR